MILNFFPIILGASLHSDQLTKLESDMQLLTALCIAEASVTSLKVTKTIYITSINYKAVCLSPLFLWPMQTRLVLKAQNQTDRLL